MCFKGFSYERSDLFKSLLDPVENNLHGQILHKIIIIIQHSNILIVLDFQNVARHIHIHTYTYYALPY